MVEAAIVTPVFFLLLFGVFEFGSAYKDKLTVTNATTSGARTASAAADDAYADYNTLLAIGKALAAAPKNSVQRIVIYKAAVAGEAPTPTCQTGTAYAGTGTARTGACNVYTLASLSQPKANFGCQTGYNLDRYYCPTSRVVALSTTNGGPPDLIGVWISMKHDYYTKFIGTSVMLTDQTVIRIEPRRL